MPPNAIPVRVSVAFDYFGLVMAVGCFAMAATFGGGRGAVWFVTLGVVALVISVVSLVRRRSHRRDTG